MYQKLIGLFKSSSVYTLGNFVNRALFLISMPIMTRYLEPKEYGTLSLVNVMIVIMTTCYGLGITTFAIRQYYECKSESEKKRLLGALITFDLLLVLCISGVFSLFGASVFAKLVKGIPFFPYGLLGIWIGFFGMVEIIPEVILRTKKKAFFYSSINFAKTGLIITLAIISVVTLKLGAKGPLLASLIVAIFFGFFYIFYFVNEIKLNFSIQIVKECLKFSLPVVSLLLGKILLDSADRMILQRFVDLSVVGFYSVGVTIGSVLVMIVSSINLAWEPYFYATCKEEEETKVKEIYSYASIYLGIGILFLALCPVIFRYEIVSILAPPSYKPVIKVIPYIMIGATLNALFFIPVRGIYQKSKTMYLLIMIFAGLLINISLNLFLIPRFQMLGAILANIGSSSVMLITCFVLSQKIYFIPYQYTRFLKAFGVCIICYLLSFMVDGYSLIISISLKFFILGLFPLFLYLIQFFESREITKIRQLISKSLIYVASIRAIV